MYSIPPDIMIDLLQQQLETKQKRKVVIKVYAMTTCPYCKQLLSPDSDFMKVIEEAKKNPELEVKFEVIYIDTDYHAWQEAYIRGIEKVPTVYINGRQINPKYYYDRESLRAIINGERPPTKPRRTIGGSWIPKLRHRHRH